MGQRPSMQQPAGEVARRPRANSGLVDSAESAQNADRRLHRSSNSNNLSRFRFQQQDSTSLSSSNSTLGDEDNRSEEGGNELATMLINHLGLNPNSVREVSSSSAPTASIQRNNSRRSDSAAHSLFHNRNAQNHHRLGGSQRLRGHRTGLSGSSSASANELLASSRLNALLQSLDAAVSTSAPTSSSSTSRLMGTQQQQVVINRLRHSLPLLQLLGRDIKCPICHKVVPSDDVEVHLILCLTRPVLSYNDDILTSDKGECAICLEEMSQGDNIARLPCLCIYHKGCIDEWFKRRNTCPEHPPAEDD